jgi:hypothetical protein
MAASKVRFTLGLAIVSAGALSALWACEDDGGGGGSPPVELDGAPSTYDATPSADARPAPEADASPDASVVFDPFAGIWRGVGDQGGGTTWTVLLDLPYGGAAASAGSVVGVMTYPSISCGGTLVVPDAGNLPDSGTSDAGPSITLHESISATCIQEGEDTFTLLPDGGLLFEYRVGPDQPVSATGVLSRVDSVGTVGSERRGVWRAGEPNEHNLRSVLVSVSRDDTVGAASGTFLIADDDGLNACGGHWTLEAKTATSLKLTEVFADGQANCTGPGTATLDTIANALLYTRTVDGGVGNTDGGVSLTRF